MTTKSLRKGLIKYDKRKGWGGPLLHIKNDKRDWAKEREIYKLEKSINWQIALIKKIKKFSIIIETEDNKEGIINYSGISWTKKEFDEILKINDIIYVEKIKDDIVMLKQ